MVLLFFLSLIGLKSRPINAGFKSRNHFSSRNQKFYFVFFLELNLLSVMSAHWVWELDCRHILMFYGGWNKRVYTEMTHGREFFGFEYYSDQNFKEKSQIFFESKVYLMIIYLKIVKKTFLILFSLKYLTTDFKNI